MKHDRHSYTVPAPQCARQKVQAEAHTEVGSSMDAIRLFLETKARMLDINHWNRYGPSDTSFLHTDASGNPIERHPRVGDHIRIEVSEKKETGDCGWICIEEFHERSDRQADMDFFAFSIKITHNPASAGKPSPFVTDGRFTLRRVGNMISVCEKWPHETPDTDLRPDTENVRHTLPTNEATMGLSAFSWECFIKELLKPQI